MYHKTTTKKISIMTNGTTTANDAAFELIQKAFAAASDKANKHYADVMKLNRTMNSNHETGTPDPDVLVAMRKESLAQWAYYEAQEKAFSDIMSDIEKRTSWAPKCN